MIESGEQTFSGSAIGSRLKSAREDKGMSLEDVANRTRIPTRHLEKIEAGDWDALPAATYTVGFARSFAGVVGLNGNEIANAIRAEIGHNRRPAVAPIYEPTDPARVPPKGLVIAAGAFALLLAVGYGVWRSTAFDNGDEVQVAVQAPNTAVPKAVAPQPTPAPATDGPVVITATDEVWLRIYEGNGGPRLKEGTMKAGERYEVPTTAAAPQILTGRPDAIQVTVGPTAIPQLGPAQRTISNVSLKPADLIARLDGANAAPAMAPNARSAP